MNVRTLYPSAPIPFESARNPRSAASAPDKGEIALRKVTDELILSKRAQAALADLKSRPETATSIEEGMAGGELSEDRRAEVNGRIQSGFYREPRNLLQIAYNMSGALTYA